MLALYIHCPLNPEKTCTSEHSSSLKVLNFILSQGCESDNDGPGNESGRMIICACHLGMNAITILSMAALSVASEPSHNDKERTPRLGCWLLIVLTCEKLHL